MVIEKDVPSCNSLRTAISPPRALPAFLFLYLLGCNSIIILDLLTMVMKLGKVRRSTFITNLLVTREYYDLNHTSIEKLMLSLVH